MANDTRNSGLIPFAKGDKRINRRGRPKSFGRYIRKETATGKELVDFHLRVLRGQESQEVVTKMGLATIGASIHDRQESAEFLASRGWGKAVNQIELESMQPMQEGLPTGLSASELFDASVQVLARVMAHLGGGVVTVADLPVLGEAVRTLQVVAKEEREIAKLGPGADLTDDQLMDEVVKRIPREKLAKALETPE